ncbi:MAG TPA: hypothetical protein VF399_09960 [bacterium]
MVSIFCTTFLIGHFITKAYLPIGCSQGVGRVCIYDSDHDGKIELIASSSNTDQSWSNIAEFTAPDTWDIQPILLDSVIIWDVGDFDNDGLTDIITYGETDGFPLMRIFESPDSSSYPSNEVWRDTVGFPYRYQPISAFDIDRDSLTELIKLDWWKADTVSTYHPFGIYKVVSDNQYDTVFMGSGMDQVSSSVAFGDYDRDGANEFVICNAEGVVQIWECMGINSYLLRQQNQLSTFNIRDCFTVPDADGDGKMEFGIKGFVPYPAYRISAFIYEATNDTTYDLIKFFALKSNFYDEYGGFSDAGDIDHDGSLEILLEAFYNVFIIKSAGNDSFYINDTLTGDMMLHGSCVRVFDLDNNGLSEIIISQNNTTRILEKGVDMEWFFPEPTHLDTFFAFDTVTLHWAVYDTFLLDSVYLYLRRTTGGSSLIFQGLPIDSCYDWAVPDTQGYFRLWLVAKGLGRKDSLASRSFFIKRESGITEYTADSPQSSFLRVLMNPFSTKTEITWCVTDENAQTKNATANLAIYDVSGREVWRYTIPSDNHQLTNKVIWDGADCRGNQLPAGVYHVYLKANSKRLCQKVVLCR